jgi:hypothetical protein
LIGEKAMDKVVKQESPIIRVTRWSVKISLLKQGSKESKKDGDTTIYGVDAEGKERVYAHVPSEQWEEWSKTDHLWNQAQSVMFDRLLSDPSTRDTVIKINIQAALEKGDEDTAIKLWNVLSETAKVELMAKPEA